MRSRRRDGSPRNVADASHQSYDLTTVRQEVADMATAAVDLLLRRVTRPEAKAQRLSLPGTLVRRSSARL